MMGLFKAVGSTLPWLWNAGKNFFGGTLKIGAGATVLGGTAAAADIVANDGQITGGIAEKFGGWWNKTINPLAVDLDNTQRLLDEQAASMSWFNTINGWLFSLCDFLGLDKAANFFQDRMKDTMQEVRGHIDEQREVLQGIDQSAQAAPSATPTVTPDAAPGDVSLGSAFGSAAYGVEKGLVTMGTALTSLVSGTYEAVTTDKGFFESVSDDFNHQNSATMDFLESVHGKPTVDTITEKALSFGGEMLTWMLPTTWVGKGATSIVSGLAKGRQVSAPAVQKLVPATP